MRRLIRPILTTNTIRSLGRVTNRILAAQNPKARAEKSWDNKPGVAFSEIRRKLEGMASGRSRCMYCEDSFGTDIDHFWPKADYPERAFLWENYLLACSFCNSNLKRKLFPIDAAGSPLLIDPTVDHPELHLGLLPTTGEYISLGVKGAESIKVFGLNDTASSRNLPLGRRQAFVCLLALLKEYDSVHVNDPNKANEIRLAAKDFPFSAVLNWLVTTAQLPNGPSVLGADVAGLIQTHNVQGWL
ncbi:hypothetical protein RG836_19140 [Pseudomonas sp. SZMC_28357]|uniref:hypothetical protein n=1 Tax=Pseudomonas sp. SZMC_28357 TaxID=3074380 RepID=UPI002870B53E|nr:hypothetical protein [Pseudomonas sp. SZMC_28357]MDR9753568.1 hypothetical protein [Pseudomonas sp. SZMC_28357]